MSNFVQNLARITKFPFPLMFFRTCVSLSRRAFKPLNVHACGVPIHWRLSSSDKKDAPNETFAKGEVGRFLVEICRLHWHPRDESNVRPFA